MAASPERMVPVTTPGGSISPATASAVSDLPEPDSPTRPTRSPGATVNDTPLTGWASPKLTRRSSTVSASPGAGLAERPVARAVLARPPKTWAANSPSTLKASPASTTAAPGASAAAGLR